MPLPEHDRHAKRKAFANEVAEAIIDHWKFRRYLREIVLQVVVEQGQLKRLGEVESFLYECESRNIHVRLDDEGKLRFTNPAAFTGELQAVLILLRKDLVEHFRQMRELERQAEQRRLAAQETANRANGQRG